MVGSVELERAVEFLRSSHSKWFPEESVGPAQIKQSIFTVGAAINFIGWDTAVQRRSYTAKEETR
jgi:hypothetical protein